MFDFKTGFYFESYFDRALMCGDNSQSKQIQIPKFHQQSKSIYIQQ